MCCTIRTRSSCIVVIDFKLESISLAIAVLISDAIRLTSCMLSQFLEHKPPGEDDSYNRAVAQAASLRF